MSCTTVIITKLNLWWRFSLQIDWWQWIPLPSQRRCKFVFLTMHYWCGICAVVQLGKKMERARDTLWFPGLESCMNMCVTFRLRSSHRQTRVSQIKGTGCSRQPLPDDELGLCLISHCYPFPISSVEWMRERECGAWILTAFYLWVFLKEEMNTWIQAITSAISSDKIEVSPTTQSTPASSRAQTLPASVTITSESSPGKREKDKEKDKEKRFSLFGKKKWTPSPHTALLWPFQWNSSMRAQNQYVTLCASCSSMWLTFFYL